MSQMSNKVLWNLPLDLVLDEDSSPISGPYPTAQAEAGCSRFLHPASQHQRQAGFGNKLRACITCVASALCHAINIQMTGKPSPSTAIAIMGCTLHRPRFYPDDAFRNPAPTATIGPQVC